MNWPKLVVEYGQGVALATIIVSALGLYAIYKRRREFLPRGVLDWIGAAIAIGVIYQAAVFLTWANAKVTPLKPVFRAANQTAPEFGFRLVADDSKRTLVDYRGKVVLLNIWATWCPECRAEMPEFDRLQKQYQGAGLVIIAVSDETSAQIAKFVGFDHMQIVKGRVEPSLPTAGLYIRPEVARPVSHIIDREGVLRETLIGGQDAASLEKRLQRYLASGRLPG